MTDLLNAPRKGRATEPQLVSTLFSNLVFGRLQFIGANWSQARGLFRST